MPYARAGLRREPDQPAGPDPVQPSRHQHLSALVHVRCAIDRGARHVLPAIVVTVTTVSVTGGRQVTRGFYVYANMVFFGANTSVLLGSKEVCLPSACAVLTLAIQRVMNVSGLNVTVTDFLLSVDVRNLNLASTRTQAFARRPLTASRPWPSAEPREHCAEPCRLCAGSTAKKDCGQFSVRTRLFWLGVALPLT